MTKIEIRTHIEVLKNSGQRRKFDFSDSQIFSNETESDKELKRLLQRAVNSIPVSENLAQKISEQIRQI